MKENVYEQALQDYISGYMIFRQKTSRYRALPGAVYDLISHRLTCKQISVADLGCGDLSLTVPLVQLLIKKDYQLANVTCVDSSKDIASHAKSEVNRLSQNSAITSISFYADDMHEFIKHSSSNKYDLIVLSHSLYKTDINCWGPFIKKTLLRVKRHGNIIIILRSRKGLVWHVLDQVLNDTEYSREKSNLFYEDYNFGEIQSVDFDKVFVEHKLLADDIRESFNIIEFLYRLPMGKISEMPELRDRIIVSLERLKSSQGYCFSFTDAVIRISDE